MLTLVYPTFHEPDTISEQGFSPSISVIDTTSTLQDLIFGTGITPITGTFTEYKKIFLLNDSDTALTNLSISLTPTVSPLVTFVLEEDVDGFIFDGEEKIKNSLITPGRVFVYTFGTSAVALGTLAANTHIGIWLKRAILSTESFDADDTFDVVVTSDQENSTFTIHHTRHTEIVSNIRWEYIRIRTNRVRVTFDHVTDETYFLGTLGLVYQGFVNKRLVAEFNTNVHDFNIHDIDSIFDIDIFAVPHAGFLKELTLDSSGKSAILDFESRRPEVFDVDNFKLFTDEATGTITTEIQGKVVAKNGTGSGNLILRSRRIKVGA